MYIANQTFKDEETLLEQLFDFGLGEASEEVKELMRNIDQDVVNNQTFQEYKASLTDEEDIMELEDEERRIRLAEALMSRYEAFQVLQQKLFGLKGEEKTLLFSVDLY